MVSHCVYIAYSARSKLPLALDMVFAEVDHVPPDAADEVGVEGIAGRGGVIIYLGGLNPRVRFIPILLTSLPGIGIFLKIIFFKWDLVGIWLGFRSFYPVLYFFWIG